ncbi:MAG: type I restriction enzyme HsdR N-terminal domain-containing protein [Thermaurantimonas sp.]
MKSKPTGYLSLNLVSPPEHAFRKVEKDWHVFDIIRRKWLVLTPEEWVRQHLVADLLSKGYPPVTLTLEKSITLNGMTRRFDLVVSGRSGTMMLVECKKFDVELDEKVYVQALRYNRSLNSPVVLITNGIMHQLFVSGMDEYRLYALRIPDFYELKNIINTP